MQILGTEIRKISEMTGLPGNELEAEMKIGDAGKIVYLTALVHAETREVNLFATLESTLALLSLFPDELAYSLEFNRIAAAGIESVLPDVDIKERYHEPIQSLLDEVHKYYELNDSYCDVSNYKREYTAPLYSPELGNTYHECAERLFYQDQPSAENNEKQECTKQVLGIEIRETGEIMGSSLYDLEAEMTLEEDGKITYLTALAYDGIKEVYLFATTESLIGLLDLFPDKKAYAHEYNKIIAASMESTVSGDAFYERYKDQISELLNEMQTKKYEYLGFDAAYSSDSNISNYDEKYVKLFYPPEMLEAHGEIREIKTATIVFRGEGPGINTGVHGVDAEIVVEDGTHLVYLSAFYSPEYSYGTYDVTTESLFDITVEEVKLGRTNEQARMALDKKSEQIESENDICRIFGKFNKYARYSKQFEKLDRMMDDALDGYGYKS